MLKIKRFFMNEFVASMLMLIIMFIIAFGILFMMAKSDKKRCEQNGGKYIWEWTYGSKCHLKNKVGGDYD